MALPNLVAKYGLTSPDTPASTSGLPDLVTTKYNNFSTAPAAAPAPSAASGISGLFSSAYTAVKNYVTGSASQAVDFEKNLVTHPIDTYNNVTSGFADGIIDAASSSFKQGTDAVSSMLDDYKNGTGSTAGDVANLAKLAGSVAGVLFSPVSGTFAGAAKVPVLKQVADAINIPFTLTGLAASYGTGKIFDIIPDNILSQKSKDTLREPISNLVSLAAQVTLGGKIFDKLSDTIKNKGSVSAQDAERIASEAVAENPGVVDPAAQTPPEVPHTKLSHEDYARSQGYEPYTPPDDLPTIDMGPKAAAPAETLPTIQIGGEDTPSAAEKLTDAYKAAGNGLLTNETAAGPEVGDEMNSFGEKTTPAEKVAARVKEQAAITAKPKMERALQNVRDMLSTSEKGERIFTEDGKVSGVNSTHDQSIPANLRRTALYQEVLPYLTLDNIDLPKTKAARELYDLLLSKAEAEAGLDHSALRQELQDEINTRRAKGSGAARKGSRSGAGATEGKGDFTFEPIKDERAAAPVKKEVVQARKLAGGKFVKPKSLPDVGDNRPSGLAKKINIEAIKAGLDEDLGKLPVYSRMSMLEQAKLAAALIEKDPQQALRVATLQEAAPHSGLLPESVSTAFRKMIADGDITGDLADEVAHTLGTSKSLADYAARLGQGIKAFDTGLDTYEDPIKIIADIQDTREKNVEGKKAAGKIVKETKKIADEIKPELKKAVSKKPTWEEFIKEIQCQY